MTHYNIIFTGAFILILSLVIQMNRTKSLTPLTKFWSSAKEASPLEKRLNRIGFVLIVIGNIYHYLG